MDRFHKTFDVYTDAGAAGNHFFVLTKIGDDLGAVDIDPCSSENPHSGVTAIKNSFRNTTGQNFGGWLFLNGVLEGGDTQPKPNFGDAPISGVDLRGATRLTFWSRGENGGEQIEFFMGGVGRDPFTGIPNKPFPDSNQRIPSIGTVFTLTKEWTEYTIDLSGVDLIYVLGGFGWVASVEKNPQGAVFWIDDIKYDKARTEDPRFIPSYVTISNQPFDIVHRNVAFTYDNAVAMLAFMASGTEDDWRRAKLIADAFVYAQTHDRLHTDGRLRNAYQAGDLRLPPGWTTNGKTDVVRLPTVVGCDGRQTGEDRIHVSSHTGNVAWAMIALLTYFQKVGGAQYLDAARLMAEWIERRRQNNGLGGFRGGYEGFDRPSAEFPDDPVEVPWASTEHNLDVFVAFTRLFQVTGDTRWRDSAEHARRLIDKVFEPGEGCVLTGTKDSDTLDRDALLLDVQAWSILALTSELSRFSPALQCAEQHHKANKDGFTGFDFNDDGDGVWFEGTCHMAAAYTRAGQRSKADELIAQLRRAQTSSPNANGKGIVSASRDGMTTGFFRNPTDPLLLFNRLHIGSTGWYVFAELGVNPFYLFDSKTPVITGASVTGKKLFVCGENFVDGAVIFINERKQKTANDGQNPSSRLIAKKSGKKVKSGDILRAQNPDGSLSREFIFTGSSSSC
jgi:hypothetical protein